MEPDDLYQLGCLGFLKAIRGFDFSYGTCFSTYAVPKIAGEIRRFLRDDGTIKVGRSIREQALTLYALRERLRQELGREPSLSELSAQTGWSPEEIAQVDLATEAPDSLQRETADGLALEGLLGTEAPEEGLVERIALREAVDQLPEKERMTILLRYFKGLTQERAARVRAAVEERRQAFWQAQLALPRMLLAADSPAPDQAPARRRKAIKGVNEFYVPCILPAGAHPGRELLAVRPLSVTDKGLLVEPLAD